MNNDIKSGIGYIIPLSSTVAFFTCLALGEYLFSISIAIAGILVWFLYMLVMESSPPSNLGNLIMFFGVLLSIGIFMGFGISKNMWGGVEFVSEGSLFSLVILFFSVLTGILFRNQSFISPVGSTYKLNRYDKKWVDKILKDNDITNEGSNPKVIVVNQNQENEKIVNQSDKIKTEASVQQNSPYVYAYPPEYYYDEYEDEDEYEYEDEE